MQKVDSVLNDSTIEYNGQTYPHVELQCVGTIIDPHWIITTNGCCSMEPDTAKFFLNVGSESTTHQIDQNGQIINPMLFLDADSLFQVSYSQNHQL